MRKIHGDRWLLTLVFLLAIQSLFSAQRAGTGEYFYTLNTQHGLSDNNILQMMQLPDGKMVIKTQRGINLYDDSHFRFLPLNINEAQELSGYRGQTHLYVDGKNRLWVKDYQTVYAINLRYFRLIPQVYGRKNHAKYAATSLVVKTPSGQFYQIRTGDNHHSVFLHFDPATRQYLTIYTCNYILHTLNMSSDRQALISSQQGYLMFDFNVSNQPQEVKELALPDGTSLVTGINTVYRDHDGGIWLGTYKDGLIYVSPLLGLFFTIDKPWWQGAWGIGLFIVILLCFVIAFFSFYRKKKNTQDTLSSEEYPNQMPMVSFSEGSSSSLEVGTSPSNDFLSKLVALIEQHLSESNYGVEQLAKDLCMERTGVYKKMKILTDESPVSLIRKVRLEKAAEMLKSSTADAMTVNEIAERTGFASPSYFTKCFKAKYGVKPSEYR